MSHELSCAAAGGSVASSDPLGCKHPSPESRRRLLLADVADRSSAIAREEEPGAPPARSLRDESDHRAADRMVIATDGEHSCVSTGWRDPFATPAITPSARRSRSLIGTRSLRCPASATATGVPRRAFVAAGVARPLDGESSQELAVEFAAQVVRQRSRRVTARASTSSLVWSQTSSAVGDCRHASKISSRRPAPSPPARAGSGGASSSRFVAVDGRPKRRRDQPR